ncbi:uncharacterized protein LOC101891246 [Musca domestica]|uniref:Uncharacterized protein LOC101891246 n=1 Tax=Musca domestica TaxID=7370 RepID=A0A1I8MZ08_MUSDO|nr:uncharacterized protein LOC101891246 [Musca domestica]
MSSTKELLLLLAMFVSGTWSEHLIDYLTTQQHSKDDEFMLTYENLLWDIWQEQPFEGLLIVQHNDIKEVELLKTLCGFPLTKIIITKDVVFEYKHKIGNSNILAVILVSGLMDEKIMEAMAQTLNYMRQVRILWLVEGVSDKEGFLDTILNKSRLYKMTNVILNFIESQPGQLYFLKPYPNYHWITSENKEDDLYYHQHWRNLENTTLVTYADQISPHSFLYEDNNEKKNIRINGLVARMVLLFAEHFNASLQMYQPLQVGNQIPHFSIINDMVDANLLDIPMALDSAYDDRWFNMSDVYELSAIMIMVPLSKQLELREIFSVLLDPYFFGCLVASSLLLSSVHCLIDFCVDGFWQYLNLLLNDKVLPGVLGQSCEMRSKHQWASHRIIYLLVGFVGLHISTQFSARMNSLFTSPPYHRQIRTFEDQRGSPVKLLVDTADAYKLSYYYDEKNIDAIFTNTSHMLEVRASLNTSYCYLARSSSWNVINQVQSHFANKLFYTPEEMYILSMTIWGFKLQFNSPFREPLNDLIHWVHAYGFRQAWYRSAFSDLLKLKWISLRNLNPMVELKVFTAHDLFWIWMLLVIGLSCGGVVFMLELWFGRKQRI